MDEQPRKDAQPLREIGGFELICKIGQGGMGSVFKARQKSLDRIVALKILPPSIAKNAKFIERFQREARACAKLNHPNIVQGVDVGKDEATGVWYFAMEFVDGQTALKLLKSERVLSEQRALEIVREVARALECAATHGVVHRDIKPDNILLTLRGEAKLADLGLARQVNDDASLTQSGQAVGTPFYMSPEQVRGASAEIDIRTDIYALGGTLFHFITGQPPFAGETSAVIMSKHLTQPVPKAKNVNPEVSDACSRLIERMMQKDRDKRVQTPSELITQIDRVLSGETTTGPKPMIGTARRKKDAVEKPASRAPLAVGTVVLIVAAGAAYLLAQKKNEPAPVVAETKPAAPETYTAPPPVKKKEPAHAFVPVPKPSPAPAVVKNEKPPVIETQAAAAPAVVAVPEKPVVPDPPEKPEVAPAPAVVPKPVSAAAAAEWPLADILAAVHDNAPKKAVERIGDGNYAGKDAMLDALKVLAMRNEARRAAITNLVGQSVKLDTTKGPQNGKLVSFKNNTLQLERAIMINGESRGTTMANVAFDDLTPAVLEHISPTPAPAAPADWIATALLSLADGQLDAADSALGHLAGNELHDPLAAELKRTRMRVREAQATTAWAKIEARANEAPSQTKAKQLIDELAAFTKKFADSDFATTPELTAKIAEMKERFERLALGLDPRVLKLFKGRVLNYDAKTQIITLGYDFKDKEQTDDFLEATWAPPGDKTGLTWRKGELRTFCKGTTDRILGMPQFLSNSLTMTFDYKKNETSRARFQVEISFHGLESTGKTPKVYFRASDKGCFYVVGNAEVKSNLDEILLLKSGTLELSCQDKQLTAKVNGKSVLEHTLPKSNDHTGFWLGGGWDSGITFTKMQVSGRLDPAWLAKALDTALKK